MAFNSGLVGAINGVGDETQAAYRRRKIAAATTGMPGDPGAQPQPVAAAPATPTGYGAGAATRNALSSGIDLSATALDKVTAPARAVSGVVGNFARGLVGAIPAASSTTPYSDALTAARSGGTGAVPGISTAAAATPSLPGAISPTTLPTLTVNGSTPNAPNLPRDMQSAWLANRGVPLSQQTDTAIGGDGSADNAAQVRRAAIQGGTTPGQNVRLGYDPTSRIYGTSSRPGGPIDTFTGIGTPDPNAPTTRIDGNSAVAANQVGLGITPGQSAAAAQVAAQRGAAPTGGLPGALDAQLDNARSEAGDVQRNFNSNLARANDPRDPIGRQILSLRRDLGSTKSRSARLAIGEQINGLIGGLNAGGSLAANARTGVENAGLGISGNLAAENLRQGGENARAAGVQAGETQRLGMQQNAPTPEIDQEGNYRLRTGAATTPITDANGQPAAAPYQLKQNPTLDRAIAARAASGASNEEVEDLYRNLISTTAASHNPGSRLPGGLSGVGVQPPKEAAAFLKQNPQYKAQFDAKYGKGAADRVLANG